MTLTAGDICNQQVQYMTWADDRVLAAIQANMPERVETLGHIFMGERIWLARIDGDVQPHHLVTPTDMDTIASEWPELHRQWLERAAGETEWDRVVTFRMRNGVETSSLLWQIVLHVSNHGSYHRGQVSAMLRAAGFTPPATDLIYWYRR